jgi:DNA-binding response OmpR family regulator
VNILVVEDEPFTAQFIKQTLEKVGDHQVFIVDNAQACTVALAQKTIELIFMDINIKGPVDGLRLALSISKRHGIRIIFITSYHDSETIKEASLSKPLGYLIKPIIKSDIEAIMMIATTQLMTQQKKEAHQAATSFSLGPLHYNKHTNTIACSDESVKFSRLEAKALKVFLQNPDVVLSSEKLLEEIWGDERSKSSLRELVSRLRKKLPSLNLQSYSNIGYILST